MAKYCTLIFHELPGSTGQGKFSSFPDKTIRRHDDYSGNAERAGALFCTRQSHCGCRAGFAAELSSRTFLAAQTGGFAACGIGGALQRACGETANPCSPGG